MATVQELRELKPEELDDRVKDLKRQLFEMKSKHNTGVLDSTADLGKTRRDVARCLTIKRQKELQAQRTGTQQAAPAGEAAGKKE